MSSNELPDLQVDGEWFRAVPPPAVPVPAANIPEPHGQPALVVLPGEGVQHDLRVLGDIHRDGDGKAWLDVVGEADYWRRQINPGSIAQTRRHQIDHVWVEHRLPPDNRAVPPPPAGEPQALLRRLAAGPDSPSARTPVPARTVPHLHGRRIIQVTPLGFAWDLRAISEPHESHDGEIVLTLTSAYDYHRWLLTGHAPDGVSIPLYLLWTE
ncbi:hypothetical protein RVR_P233 (plasmid) [Actinacidiphila reveromycinica]|uniref:Uncharacterized protein n=1 Tax=Actinacidiphila reveromycinica TaxID=659352 RepID=A0A7U3QW30_9ACTN|nr:hypothetical protein [Streptomyces sp. SN-593]BBG20774.1 hypothetical protein RVR_P233 [Streptomyces sp. SN-593]